MQSRERTNSWLEPQTLLGVAGFLSLIWSGYQQFQRDTAADVNRLSERVTRVEAQVEMMRREK